MMNYQEALKLVAEVYVHEGKEAALAKLETLDIGIQEAGTIKVVIKDLSEHMHI